MIPLLFTQPSTTAASASSALCASISSALEIPWTPADSSTLSAPPAASSLADVASSLLVPRLRQWLVRERTTAEEPLRAGLAANVAAWRAFAEALSEAAGARLARLGAAVDALAGSALPALRERLAEIMGAAAAQGAGVAATPPTDHASAEAIAKLRARAAAAEAAAHAALTRASAAEQAVTTIRTELEKLRARSAQELEQERARASRELDRARTAARSELSAAEERAHVAIAEARERAEAETRAATELAAMRGREAENLRAQLAAATAARAQSPIKQSASSQPPPPPPPPEALLAVRQQVRQLQQQLEGARQEAQALRARTEAARVAQLGSEEARVSLTQELLALQQRYHTEVAALRARLARATTAAEAMNTVARATSPSGLRPPDGDRALAALQRDRVRLTQECAQAAAAAARLRAEAAQLSNGASSSPLKGGPARTPNEIAAAAAAEAAATRSGSPTRHSPVTHTAALSPPLGASATAASVPVAAAPAGAGSPSAVFPPSPPFPATTPSALARQQEQLALAQYQLAQARQECAARTQQARTLEQHNRLLVDELEHTRRMLVQVRQDYATRSEQTRALEKHSRALTEELEQVKLRNAVCAEGMEDGGNRKSDGGIGKGALETGGLFSLGVRSSFTSPLSHLTAFFGHPCAFLGRRKAFPLP